MASLVIFFCLLLSTATLSADDYDALETLAADAIVELDGAARSEPGR